MLIFLSFYYAAAILAIATYSVLYYIFFWRKISQWMESNIPFIHPPFLIGPIEFSKLYKNALPAGTYRIYRENEGKGIIGFFMTFLPVILIRDPALLQNIFAKNYDKNFATFFNVPKEEIETQSILAFTSDKTQWQVGRSVMAPMFSPSRIEPLFPKYKNQMDRLCYQLEESRLQGQPISVKHFADNFVFDTVIDCTFSQKTNSYKKKPELHSVYRDFFDFHLRRQFSVLVYLCAPAVYGYTIKVFKSFKFLDQNYFDFMSNYLNRKMEERMRSKAKNNDFIDFILSLKQADTTEGHNGESRALTKSYAAISLRQMTGYGITSLLAATDPVSHLCISAVHLLSLHREHQDRIKKEIDDVMKKHGVSEFTHEVIQDLRFTRQCLYETERLFPLLRAIVRNCSKDFQIPGTDYKFREGDIFIAVPYAMHRDPKYFEDPNKFDPERFSPENKDSFRSDAYIPFGLGPRKCPAFKTGVLHAVMFVASLLAKYIIRPLSHLQQMTADDLDPEGVMNLPKEELLIDLIPRYNCTVEPYSNKELI